MKNLYLNLISIHDIVAINITIFKCISFFCPLLAGIDSVEVSCCLWVSVFLSSSGVPLTSNVVLKKKNEITAAASRARTAHVSAITPPTEVRRAVWISWPTNNGAASASPTPDELIHANSATVCFRLEKSSLVVSSSDNRIAQMGLRTHMCAHARVCVLCLKYKKICSAQPYMLTVADHLLLTPQGFLESPTGSKKELQHLSSSCQQHRKGKYIFTHVKTRQSLAASKSYLVLSKCIACKQNTNDKRFQALTASQYVSFMKTDVQCLEYDQPIMSSQSFFVFLFKNTYKAQIHFLFVFRKQRLSACAWQRKVRSHDHANENFVSAGEKKNMFYFAWNTYLLCAFTV